MKTYQPQKTCFAAFQASLSDKQAVKVGLGYRNPLASWIESNPAEIECLEITAEHFFDGGDSILQTLSRHYALYLHGLGGSLGTPGPLDAGYLESFRHVSQIANPEWISEHIAFTRSDEVDLGHLNPIAPTRRNLHHVAEHARQLSVLCEKPILLENITTHLPLKGELSEPDFLNQLCELADCGLLLDVTNLFINSRNHRFDPVKWLQSLNPEKIIQLHVVGYTEKDGRFLDTHSSSIQSDLWDLIRAVLEYATPRAIIVERDAHFPSPRILARELTNLKEACANT